MRRGWGDRETCTQTCSYSPAVALTSLAPPFLVLRLATNRKYDNVPHKLAQETYLCGAHCAGDKKTRQILVFPELTC